MLWSTSSSTETKDELCKCSLVLVCGNFKGLPAWRHLKQDNHLKLLIYLTGQQREVTPAVLLGCERIILQLAQLNLK